MGSDETPSYVYRKQVKGHRYLYFRRPDGKLIRLPDDEGSAEFRRCYAACLKALKTAPAPSVQPERVADTRIVAYIGGTVGAAIKVYYASADFRDLRASSQAKYRKALDLMLSRVGETKLADWDVDAVDIFSDQISTAHGPSVASFQVSMFSNLWKVCRKFPEFCIKGKANPTGDAERRYRVKSPHKPWTEDAQDTFMATASESLRLAKLMLHFSAQRGGDCVKIKWTDFDGKGLFVRPEKQSDGEDIEPNYHLCPKPLLDALLARQERGNLAETILTNAHGKPWANSNSLSCAIREHLIKIGLAARGKKTFSMHGLRKNAASEVGALLVGSAGIKSVTGHKSDAMADYYAKHASRIAMNREVVERWDAAISAKSEAKASRRRATLRRVK
jgi:integrase